MYFKCLKENFWDRYIFKYIKYLQIKIVDGGGCNDFMMEELDISYNYIHNCYYNQLISHESKSSIWKVSNQTSRSDLCSHKYLFNSPLGMQRASDIMFPQLKRLHLNNNYITLINAMTINNLPNLTFLNLTNNFIESILWVYNTIVV